jgi:hypothetical protein
MAGTRTFTYDEAEWKQEDFCRRELREARKTARKNYCLVIIKVRTEHFGTVVRGTIDGRYWLMDPKDFVEEKPPKPGSDERRALAKRVKAPSFLF